MNPIETNRVANIGRNDPEAIAKTVGLRDLVVPPRPVEITPGRTPSKLPRIALAGAVAGTAAWLLAPRGNEAPDPVPPTQGELAEQSAEKPYDPATGTLVVGNITVKPGNPNKDTPSEAVMNNKEVQQYIADNPDEFDSLYTSATSLDDHSEYAVVKPDGDGDAVARPVESRQ